MRNNRKDALRKLLDDLADRIRSCESETQRRELDRETRQLALQHGDWVYDAISDRLSVGEDTYSQDLQDWYRTTRACMLISRAQHGPNLPVALVGNNPELLEALRLSMGVLEILSSILPVDFHRIRSDAQLSPIEFDCFYYWLRSYTPKQMAQWLVKPDGTAYKYRSIVAILRRTWRKIQYCPSVAWRTCLAEDMARGRNAEKPRYMSWSDIVATRPGYLPADAQIPDLDSQ